MEELNLGVEGISSIESGENLDGNLEKKIEQIEQSLEKAKKIRKKMTGIKRSNNLLAKFLEYLINVIPQKQLKLLTETFFYVQKDGHIFKNPKPNILLIAGLYAPFFKEKVKEFKLDKFFSQFNFQNASNFVSYLEYFNQLFNASKIEIYNKDLFTKLILEILLHHKFVEIKEDKDYDIHHKKIHQKLYGN